MTKALKSLSEEASKDVEQVSTKEALSLFKEGNTVFVDVREDHERAGSGTIPGAVHLPRSLLEWKLDCGDPNHRPEVFDAVRPIFFCGGGGRGLLSAKLAQEMGVTGARNLNGGFRAWVSFDGPLV
ncbi:rhodanese-like domain-containing protein [Cognatishimia sp. D5M38]|uniref:Rhodanese-like domain-containing protein n=1 Tax=Cognatishimia coralii TaxID=3083254 RepID=A0ABU8QKE2_9RHOB